MYEEKQYNNSDKLCYKLFEDSTVDLKIGELWNGYIILESGALDGKLKVYIDIRVLKEITIISHTPYHDAYNKTYWFICIYC